MYVSPDGKYFLTVSSADIIATELLRIRKIDGTIVKEMLWTSGAFLNTYNQPDFDNLSALWSPDGSILIIKGKEYDGEKVTFGTVTLFNASDFSEQTIPDFGVELMDTGFNENGTFLLYNDTKHIRDYYSVNISTARSGLIIGEPIKLSLGQCFSAYKNLTVIGDDLYCLTSTLLFKDLKSKRNPDFPNGDRLLIHQKLGQDKPTDFSVVSPIIANSDYLVVTSDNKYLISYLGTASHDGTVPSENNVVYPPIVYETKTGKQYQITDKNSLLYAAKPVQHRFLKFTGEI